MSPRRSSRARAAQPPPAQPTHTNSSTSSVSSGRAERSTRSKDKLTPSQRSDPRSQSIDDFDDSSRPLRRTRSGADEIKDPKVNSQEDQDEEDGEEEEITRCICGQMEYPGLPSPTYELLKLQAKEPGATYTLDAITDDLGGLFIQCDICKVWQHGGCVNILDDAAVPEEYFCEKCRRDFHKVATSPSGQKYSDYLPLKEELSPPTSPQFASRERSKRIADNRGSQVPEPKRRATMNSREIYNEAEALRRAIEESKKDERLDGVRKKRSRSDSEERKDSGKRQRVGGNFDSPDADRALLSNSSSDEALATKLAADHTPKKNIRGAAARNHQAKELRDQKERDRQEAAAKRRSRVERRHGDESPGIDDPSNPPPPSTVSTPPTADFPAPRSSHRKGASRNPQSSTTTATSKNTRRVGRNQYTKDLPPSSLSNTLDPNANDARNGSGMRTRSRSRSNARDLESPSGGGLGSGANGGASGAGPGPGGGAANGLLSGGDISRPSKPKHMNPNRTSMNEMKKRVAAILEFVNRAEEEGRKRGMTVSSTSTSSVGAPSSSGSGGSGTLVSSAASEEGGGLPEGVTKRLPTPLRGEEEKEKEKEVDFGALDSADMLRILKMRLVGWEGEYGRYGSANR